MGETRYKKPEWKWNTSGRTANLLPILSVRFDRVLKSPIETAFEWLWSLLRLNYITYYLFSKKLLTPKRQKNHQEPHRDQFGVFLLSCGVESYVFSPAASSHFTYKSVTVFLNILTGHQLITSIYLKPWNVQNHKALHVIFDVT